MKKLSLFVVCIITFALLYAGSDKFDVISKIGPTFSSSNVTIAAPGTGRTNCLTSFSVIGSSTYTFRILDGGTTNFQVLMAAGAGYSDTLPRDDARCSTTTNVSTTLSVDNGAFTINYQGFVR